MRRSDIKRVRKQLGLSQEAMARRLNISTVSWQSYELGKRKLSQEKWEAFKVVLEQKT